MTDTTPEDRSIVLDLPAQTVAALQRRAAREQTTMDELVAAAVTEWLVWRATPTAG